MLRVLKLCRCSHVLLDLLFLQFMLWLGQGVGLGWVLGHILDLVLHSAHLDIVADIKICDCTQTPVLYGCHVICCSRLLLRPLNHKNRYLHAHLTNNFPKCYPLQFLSHFHPHSELKIVQSETFQQIFKRITNNKHLSCIYKMRIFHNTISILK